MSETGTGRKSELARTIGRYLLAVVYLLAGIGHIRNPGLFLLITPAWVPAPEFVILATGICEIAGAIALAFVPRLRYAAGIALAAYAVCVFPANINHAIYNIAANGHQMSWWYHGPRLAFQPVFVWWALWAGRVIDWPFGQKKA